MATNNVGTAPNLSLLSRGVGAVKRNGHERIDVHLEPEDYFNYIDSPRRFILPPLIDHQPPLQPKYAFEVSPRSNGSGPREFQEVALPKTFTTRKGALLLFSEEFAMKSGQDEFGEEFHDRHQHKETEEPDLKTVDDLARSILSYGSHRSEVHLKFVRDVATTRRVRPGFSARRYLSRLTRSFDDTFLDNLMAKGYVNEKTLFQSNSVRPNMRRRINDDLSYMPTPYRIMRQMLMAPGMLSGYSFSKSRTMDSEVSGFSVIEEEDEGEVSQSMGKDPRHRVQVVEVKEGVPHTVLYGALSQEDKENVLADLLVKSAINHALDKQNEKLTEVREEEDTEVTSAKEMVRVSDPPMPRRASVTEFNMAEAVQSYLESQVDSASLADGSTTSQTGLRGGKVPPHSARSFEEEELSVGPKAHERPWPDRQGEKEFIGGMPVIALRNPRSTGTTPSPANSRHPSASGSATAAPPDEQYAAPQKALTPIIDVSREVSLNPIPILPPIQGDKGHSRGTGKSDIKVPHLIFDPATPSTTRPHGTSSQPASAHPSLHDSVRSIEAHEAEGSRRGVGSDSRFSRKKGSQRSVVSLDSSASHISAGGLGGAGGYNYSSTESLNVDPAAREARGGAMRGKALKVGGDKSAASRKGVGSVKGPGSVKGSVVYGPHGEVMSVGGSILSRQPTPTDFHHSDPHVDTVSEPGNLQGSDDEEEWAGRRRSGVKSADLALHAANSAIFTKRKSLVCKDPIILAHDGDDMTAFDAVAGVIMPTQERYDDIIVPPPGQEHDDKSVDREERYEDGAVITGTSEDESDHQGSMILSRSRTLADIPERDTSVDTPTSREKTCTRESVKESPAHKPLSREVLRSKGKSQNSSIDDMKGQSQQQFVNQLAGSSRGTDEALKEGSSHESFQHPRGTSQKTAEIKEDQMKDEASSTERDASLDTVAPSNPVSKSSETGDTLATGLEEPELPSSMSVDVTGEDSGQISDTAEHLKMASEIKTDDHKDGSEAGSLERSQGISPERSHVISLERSVEGSQETPQQGSQERSQEDLQQHSPLLSQDGTPEGNTNQNAVPSPDNRDPHGLLSTQEGEVTALSGGASNAPDQTLPAIMLKEATEHKTGASQSEHSSLAGENLAFDRPITEQELVKALSEHAHNIAMATLSRPGTGLDITTDAQVAAGLWLASRPASVTSALQKTPRVGSATSVVIEQMLSGGMDASNPSVDEYKDMLRETLSSVVSKMSGGTPENFPQDVEVAPELIEALTQHQLSPDDIEVVQDDTGKSVIRVKSSASSVSKMESSGTAGGSTKEDVVKERFKDEKLRVGKLRSASILSNKNMTDQTTKGDVGSLDIINYGEKEQNEAEKQVVVRPPQVGSEVDGDGDERRSKRSSARNDGSGQQGKAGASGRSSQASTNKTVKDEDDDAKLRQLLETMVQPQDTKSPKLSGTVSTKTSAKSKKSFKSDKSKKSRKSGEKEAEAKKGLEDRDEFVVGKVDDKKELEMLYKPLEEPAKPKEKKPRVPQAKSPKKGKKKSSKKERESGESPASSSSKLPSPGPPVEAPPPKEAPPPSPPKSPSWHSEKTEEEEEMEFIFVRDEFDETPPPQTATKSKPKSPDVDTEDSSLSDSDGESDISGNLKQISNKDARAAKRAAQAAKRREEVEKKRKEREESIRHEREEAERKDRLQRELEEDRKRREDEKRLKRERAEEELRRKELESQERARRARIDQEKEKRQKEEYQRKLVEMRRKQQEEDRIRQEQEEERRKEEELRRIQEELMMSQMEEQERIEYEKRKKEEEERRKIEEEEARIRREEEARIAMEEAKRLADEMARKKAEFERRLQFNRGLQLESTGLEHTQDITRAFVFSYYEFLQWLGLEVPDFERLKKSMGM